MNVARKGRNLQSRQGFAVDGRRKGRMGPSGPKGIPELLAPAGSAEAYFAAADAGADAVYLGFPRFSARERAENFTLDDYARVLPHARRRGVRIYLAMNTVLSEADLPDAISLLHRVAPLSPDGVIVADLGLLRIVRRFFPTLPIHVSTQAGCSSLAAADRFAQMGAERVILERHLTLPEVRRIVARSRAGIEIFVHGAMCYSYSGKCFFSSYLGGKSANRGACVQPCRRLYGHPSGEEAIFSTRDLSLMELLPELVPLGFAAFKIEGRMRGAEYVAGVVSAYRTALDRIRDGSPREGVAEGMRILSEVLGRERTPGLTGGAAPGDVAAGGTTGNVGELLGTVEESREGWLRIRSGTVPSRGDRLRVQFREEGSGRGFSALSVREEPGGFRVHAPFPASPGDLLLRVGGGRRGEFTRSAKREMEGTVPDGVRFRIRIGEGAVQVTASYGTMRRQYRFRVEGGIRGDGPGIPADAEAILRSRYRFDLPAGEILVEARGEGVRWEDAVEMFLRAARSFDKEHYLAGKQLRLSILPTLRVAGNREETVPTLFFVGCTADQLDHISPHPMIVPVVEFTKAVARDPVAAARGFRNRLCFRLSPPLLEGEEPFLRRTVREAVGKGFRRWFVNDVGHFRLFDVSRPRKELYLVGDHYLYSGNTGALAQLSSMGASRMVLPVEADLPSLRALGKFLHDLGIAVAYGALPLMISRILPAAGIRKGTVTSPRGEEFFVTTGDRGSAILPARPFSASGALHEIRAAGIRDFSVDLRGLPPDRISPILDALFADRAIPGTVSFNLFRGRPPAGTAKGG